MGVSVDAARTQCPCGLILGWLEHIRSSKAAVCRSRARWIAIHCQRSASLRRPKLLKSDSLIGLLKPSFY